MSEQQADIDLQKQLWRSIRARHPPLWPALLADASITASYRGERSEFRSRTDAVLQMARLAWTTDAFVAQVLYRVKARLQSLRVPLLPRLAHKLAMATAQVSIGDPVVIEPGLYIIHGQIVIDGLVEIGTGAVIAPWVTIGLRAGNLRGATIARDVSIGTGAKVIGPVTLGIGANVGANAVVVNDVAAGSTVVGVPARPHDSPSDG